MIRTKENSVFTIHDTKGTKLLMCLGLNFSHLKDYKFKHGLRDTVDPICKCIPETEATLHFLLVAGCILIIEDNIYDMYILASSRMNYP